MTSRCPVLNEMFATGKAVDSNGTVQNVNSGLSIEDALALHEIVTQSQAKEVLEAGMAFAVSSLAILSSPVMPTLTSIDPFQASIFIDVGMMSVEKAGYHGRHCVIKKPDYEALPNLLSQGKKFDFAFIDGWHTFDYTFIDWWYIDKMIEVGGIVGFDDCQMPSVEKVIAFVLSHRRYQVVDGVGSHRTKYLKKTEEFEPTWDFFSPF